MFDDWRCLQNKTLGKSDITVKLVSGRAWGFLTRFAHYHIKKWSPSFASTFGALQAIPLVSWISRPQHAYWKTRQTGIYVYYFYKHHMVDSVVILIITCSFIHLRKVRFIIPRPFVSKATPSIWKYFLRC